MGDRAGTEVAQSVPRPRLLEGALARKKQLIMGRTVSDLSFRGRSKQNGSGYKGGGPYRGENPEIRRRTIFKKTGPNEGVTVLIMHGAPVLFVQNMSPRRRGTKGIRERRRKEREKGVIIFRRSYGRLEIAKENACRTLKKGNLIEYQR